MTMPIAMRSTRRSVSQGSMSWTKRPGSVCRPCSKNRPPARRNGWSSSSSSGRWAGWNGGASNSRSTPSRGRSHGRSFPGGRSCRKESGGSQKTPVRRSMTGRCRHTGRAVPTSARASRKVFWTGRAVSTSARASRRGFRRRRWWGTNVPCPSMTSPSSAKGKSSATTGCGGPRSSCRSRGGRGKAMARAERRSCNSREGSSGGRQKNTNSKTVASWRSTRVRTTDPSGEGACRSAR